MKKNILVKPVFQVQTALGPDNLQLHFRQLMEFQVPNRFFKSKRLQDRITLSQHLFLVICGGQDAKCFVHFICCSDLKKLSLGLFGVFVPQMWPQMFLNRGQNKFLNSFLILCNIKSYVLNLTLFLRIQQRLCQFSLSFFNV